MHRFGKVSSKEFSEATEGIMYGGDRVCEVGEGGNEDHALFFEKCLTLFGDPNCTSPDWENMYDYNTAACFISKYITVRAVRQRVYR